MAPPRNHNHHTYAGVGLKKGPWSAAEDAILIDYVRKHGDGNWNELQRNTSLQRCGKSCRLRWTNHLRPNLKKGAFSPDEERLIVDLHSKLGNKWARISSHLPGRTDNEVKNYWNTRVKRRLRHGLPLYPNQQQHQSHSPSISPPPSSLSPPILKTPTIPTPFLFNPNTQLPFLTGGGSTPCFDPNTWPSSDLGFLFDPDLDMTQFISETHPFGSVSSSELPKLELPSNQFRSHDDAAQAAAEFEAKVNYPNLLFTNPSTRNSGLLDSLLLESRYRAARAIGNSSTTSNNNPKKEKVEGFDQFNAPTYMDECLCCDGGVEIKKENVDEDEQDQHRSSNSSMMNEDLSSIFKQISSSPPPDEWCDCCQEPAAAAASEEEDIYNVNIAAEFHQMPPLIHQNHSPPAADQPDWFDDTNGILSLLGMNNSKDKFFTSC